MHLTIKQQAVVGELCLRVLDVMDRNRPTLEEEAAQRGIRFNQLLAAALAGRLCEAFANMEDRPCT